MERTESHFIDTLTLNGFEDAYVVTMSCFLGIAHNAINSHIFVLIFTSMNLQDLTYGIRPT